MRQLILPGVFLLVSAVPPLAITCHGNYQVVAGQEISTPYCRDNALAAVARTYGYRDSDSTVRNNPSRKEELCRKLNSDIRVQTAFADVFPSGSGGR